MNLIRRKTQKLWPALCVAACLSLMVGCGDDSSASPSASPAVPAESSSSAGDNSLLPEQGLLPEYPIIIPDNPNISSSAGAVGVESSSSGGVDVPVVAGTINRDPAAINLAATPDGDGFYDVGDVYKAVPADQKIVFVLRHAERESSLGQESMLTELGVQQALAAGQKLAGEEPFYYASTDFIRTRETANNIAKGRGEIAEVVTWEAINGGYFLTVPSDSFDALVQKRGGSWKNMSQWAYGVPFSNPYVAKVGDAYFYELFSRGDQFINEVILDNLPRWKRVNVLVSHDVLLEPLIVYATNRQIDLKFYESGRWVNYLSGVAVIVNENGLATLLPVRGTEIGYMTVQKETAEE